MRSVYADTVMLRRALYSLLLLLMYVCIHVVRAAESALDFLHIFVESYRK